MQRALRQSRHARRVAAASAGNWLFNRKLRHCFHVTSFALCVGLLCAHSTIGNSWLNSLFKGSSSSSSSTDVDAATRASQMPGYKVDRCFVLFRVSFNDRRCIVDVCFVAIYVSMSTTAGAARERVEQRVERTGLRTRVRSVHNAYDEDDKILKMTYAIRTETSFIKRRFYRHRSSRARNSSSSGVHSITFDSIVRLTLPH